MGAITVSPKHMRPGLYLRYYPSHAVNRFDVIDFLRNLLRQIQKPLLVIADRGNIHRAKEVKAYLRRSTRISLEHFPSYAPDLNPIEGLWSTLKSARLANYCPTGPEELLDTVAETGRAIGQERRTLRGFLRGAGLPWRLAPE